MSKPRYIWWGYVKAIIREYSRTSEYPAISTKEREAVRLAVENTRKMGNGSDIIKMVDMVFWKQTHTLSGAAQAIPCSERTARRWHTEFIKLVAKEYGLLE